MSFLRNSCNSFDQILVIYGDHFHKQKCMNGIFNKVTEYDVGTKIQNVDFVETISYWLDS
jgi:hypothetical protein